MSAGSGARAPSGGFGYSSAMLPPVSRPLPGRRAVLALCARALVGGFLAGCGGGSGARLLVAVASSLRELFEGETAPHAGPPVACSFDASSTLARQIRAGAPFDAFVSADERSLARVASWAGDDAPRPFLRNRLALIARAGLELPPSGPGAPLAVLPHVPGRIAIGGPEVPAGRYARRLLEREHLLPRLEARFVHGRNARAVLGLVESGAAELGLVYHTDALCLKRGRHVWSAPPGDEPQVRYWVQASRASGEPGQAFVAWLAGGGVAPAARERGFLDPVG